MMPTSSTHVVATGRISFFSIAESKKDKFIETESRIVVRRSWESEGIGEMLFKGTNSQPVDE